MMTLLVLLLQTTALLALGLLALRVTQKHGPAVQTLVGRATLCGAALLVLLLPLSGRVSPVWRVAAEPTPARQEPTPVRPSSALPKREGKELSPIGALRDAPSVMPTVLASPSAVPAGPPQPVPISAPGAARSALMLHPVLPAPRPPASRGPLRSNLLQSKEVGLPTLLLLLWLIFCRWHLICLRRTAQPVTDGLAAALLTEQTPHPPLLLTHPSVHSPFLAGTRRPAIFLPPAFAADLDPDTLRAVFLHELAHRDRRDNLWTLAARVLTALLWFQPLLWLLGRRLEQISEDACDQAVLASHCPPRAYAACLLSLAERPPLAHSQRTLTAGVAPFRSSVGRRIARILTEGVPIMPAVTLRLRLTIAALTLAAATGGAFLVSSAPAQTQPKPASVVGTWLGPFWGGDRVALIFSPDGQIDQVGSWPGDRGKVHAVVSHWLGTYTALGSHMTWRLTRTKVGDAPPYGSDSDAVKRDLEYRLSGDTLTIHLNAKDGWTQIYHRTAAYTPEMLGITPNAASAASVSADSHLTTAQHLEYAAQENDMTHLEVIGLAITEYAEHHNERLPDADHWMDQIQPYLSQPGAYCDPFRPGPKQHGYAFNRNCSRQLLTAFPKPDQTVIVFDSPFAARNASNTGQTVRTWNKPTDKALIPGSGFLFVNGVAHWYGPDVHPSFLLQGGQPTALSERQAKVKADYLVRHYKGNIRIYGASNNGTPVLLGATKPNQQLDQAQFLAGLTAVQGPGVVVTLRDSKKPFPYPKGFPAGMVPPNLIHDTDINQTINELKAAGAEALSVNNQRLVATSAIRHEGQTILINNTPQAPPYVIEVIGDPKALTTMLTMRGGEADQIKQFDTAMFSVKQAAMLTLPAYTGTGEMRYAKPVGIGAQASSNLPKRLFVINFQVPSTGTHAVQVYVIDAAGRHLASAKAYGPGTKVSLPVQAVGRSVSFQIYDNGRLTKTQQIASGPATPAPIIKPATAADAARMHTIVGYGLVSWTLGKVRQCRAVTNSPASRAGVPTEWNSMILGVNGQKVPPSDVQFTAVCRSSPALHLLLASIDGKKPYPVTISAKAPFSVLTDAADAEDHAKYLQSVQADAATAKAAQAYTNQQLAAAIQAALPQARSSTLAKALNLEKRVGWSLSGQKLWSESKAASQKKNHPQSVAKFQRYEEEASARLGKATAEENALFPKTTATPQALSRIHALAVQSYNGSMTGMEKQIIEQVAESMTKQRGPAVTF